MVRFLHTADWQIGKQFSNIEGDVGAFLRNQRIETIGKIGELATQHQVDFVLVAGDVFDSTGVRGKTIMQTFSAMADSFEGQWFLLPGNHDPAENGGVWSRVKATLSSETILILDEPAPFLLNECRTLILPAPLQRRHDARDLTNWFDTAHPEAAANWVRIGIAHGSLDNRLQVECEAMNRISDTRVQSAKLNYLALGDWHGTMKIADRTWYSGTPEPDRFRDNDSGNVLLVDIDGPGSEPEVQKIAVGHYKWCQIEHQIFGESDINTIEHQLVTSGHEPDRTLLRLSLRGVVSLETRTKLTPELEHLAARLFHLETDDTNLVAEPDDEDLAQLSQMGFVRAVVNDLVAMVKDTGSAESETARLALQILYSEHKSLTH